ncbi:hypothetical protein FRC11_007945 [Ceratobasidium sp. 423]|nr:hypothetical protein FRC11_007945 [Ceratobasidium sp. 423]
MAGKSKTVPENTPLGAEKEASARQKTGGKSKNKRVTFRALHNFVFYRKNDMVLPNPNDCYKPFLKSITAHGHVAPMTGEARDLVQSGWWNLRHTDLVFSAMDISNISGLHCLRDKDYRGGAPALYLESAGYIYVLLAPSQEYASTWDEVVSKWAEYSKVPKSELIFDWVNVFGPQPSWWKSMAQWGILQDWAKATLPAPSTQSEPGSDDEGGDEDAPGSDDLTITESQEAGEADDETSGVDLGGEILESAHPSRTLRSTLLAPSTQSEPGSDDEGGDEDAPGSDDLTITESQEAGEADDETSGVDLGGEILESAHPSRTLRSTTRELRSGSKANTLAPQALRTSHRLSGSASVAFNDKGGDSGSKEITKKAPRSVKGKEAAIRSALKVSRQDQGEAPANASATTSTGESQRKRARILSNIPEEGADSTSHEEAPLPPGQDGRNDGDRHVRASQVALRVSHQSSNLSAGSGESSSTSVPIDKRFPIVRDRVVAPKRKVMRPAASSSSPRRSLDQLSQASRLPGVVPPFTQIPSASSSQALSPDGEQTMEVPMDLSDSEEPTQPSIQLLSSKPVSPGGSGGYQISVNKGPGLPPSKNRGGSAPPTYSSQPLGQLQSSGFPSRAIIDSGSCSSTIATAVDDPLSQSQKNAEVLAPQHAQGEFWLSTDPGFTAPEWLSRPLGPF